MQRTGSGSQAAPTPSGTPIAWSELEAAFAPERLAPYLNHLGGDRDRAVALYLWNIALCESLYPLLNLSEITLRNRFHQVLSQHFQRQDWYDDAWLDQRDASKVLEAKQKIARHRLSPTPGRVVAELTFGFWANTWRRRGHTRATQGPHKGHTEPHRATKIPRSPTKPRSKPSTARRAWPGDESRA